MKIKYALPLIAILGLNSCGESSEENMNSDNEDLDISITDTTITPTVELNFRTDYLQDSLLVFGDTFQEVKSLLINSIETSSNSYDCEYGGSYNAVIENYSLTSVNGYVEYIDCSKFDGVLSGKIEVNAIGNSMQGDIIYTGDVIKVKENGDKEGFSNLSYLESNSIEPTSNIQTFYMNLTASIDGEDEVVRYFTKEALINEFPYAFKGFVEIEGINETTIGYNVATGETFLNGEVENLGLGFYHIRQ